MAYLDGFDRPNDAVSLGPNWIEQYGSLVFGIGTLQVFNNNLYINFTNQDASAYWGVPFNEYQFSRIQLKSAGANQGGYSGPTGPAVRLQSGTAKSGYAASIIGSGGFGTTAPFFTGIFRGDGASWTRLVSAGTGFVPGDFINILASANVITVYVNGAPVVSVSDSTYPSGHAGFAALGPGTSPPWYWDDWMGGDALIESPRMTLSLNPAQTREVGGGLHDVPTCVIPLTITPEEWQRAHITILSLWSADSDALLRPQLVLAEWHSAAVADERVTFPPPVPPPVPSGVPSLRHQKVRSDVTLS